MSNFPYVCSNYDFTGSVLEGLVKPWITINRSGIKIGVFGLAGFACAGMSFVGARSFVKSHDWHYAAGAGLYALGAVFFIGWVFSMGW